MLRNLEVKGLINVKVYGVNSDSDSDKDGSFFRSYSPVMARSFYEALKNHTIKMAPGDHKIAKIVNRYIDEYGREVLSYETPDNKYDIWETDINPDTFDNDRNRYINYMLDNDK